MVWPAQSLDINVIENCCLRIKRTRQYRAGGITNSGQLLDTILDIWQNFTVEYVYFKPFSYAVMAFIDFDIQSRANSIRGKWRTSRLSCLALAILNLGKSKIS
jgi:hypothetical protein